MWGTQGAGKNSGNADDELSGEDADDPLEVIPEREAFQIRCKLFNSPSRRLSQASTTMTSSGGSENMGAYVDNEESADHEARASYG